MIWNSEFDIYIGHLKNPVSFERIAVHYVVLPPGKRTSTPHAESHEEEFVFVLQGRPHLWLNGYIHELEPGFAVGFPAGTGIAQTLINNSNTDIHMLVVGEKTKKENLCSYPINPELKETSPIWWTNPPPQKLGPHSGLPGPVLESDRAPLPAACILNSPRSQHSPLLHYPGDNETFASGIRLTDKIGLKALGIWYEHLPPGRRTAFPHAHTHEEEIVFICHGTPTLWLDGYVKQLRPNDFVAFPPGTGIAHTLINDTNEDVIFIGIGETKEFPNEKISYPLHPLRQKECLRKGWYWTDVPTKSFGPHNGSPRRPFQDHIRFEVCTAEDAPAVLEVFEQSKHYFRSVEGCDPTLSLAQKSILEGPKTTSKLYFKEFLTILLNGKNVGVLDLHANHPEEGVCYLGLLLIREDLFGRRWGSRFYQLAEDYVRRSFGAKKIRLGISDDNDVSGFWLKMGFQPNGRFYEWPGHNKVTNVREFEKTI